MKTDGSFAALVRELCWVILGWCLISKHILIIGLNPGQSNCSLLTSDTRNTTVLLLYYDGAIYNNGKIIKTTTPIFITLQFLLGSFIGRFKLKVIIAECQFNCWFRADPKFCWLLLWPLCSSSNHSIQFTALGGHHSPQPQHQQACVPTLRTPGSICLHTLEPASVHTTHTTS